MNVLARVVLFLTLSCFGKAAANDYTIQDLVARIETLERTNCGQQVETIDNANDAESIESLRAELRDLKQDLSDKEERIQALEAIIQSSNLPNGGQQNGDPEKGTDGRKPPMVPNNMMQQKYHSRHGNSDKFSKGRIRPGRALVAGLPVGFHAVSSHNEAHLGAQQALIFDTVLTNTGSAFHSNHGTFIAPTHGLYLFSLTAASAGESAHMVIAAELVKDGSLLAKTYAKSDPGYFDQGSVTVVTELQPGNEVWARLNHPLDTTLASGSFSSFTGVLLYEYEA